MKFLRLLGTIWTCVVAVSVTVWAYVVFWCFFRVR